ncbi:MAG: hypothetical protein ACLP22_15790 [Solirubrobacteraceae bacterium]
MVAGTAHRTGPGLQWTIPATDLRRQSASNYPSMWALGEYPTADRRPDELAPSAKGVSRGPFLRHTAAGM